MIDSRLLRKDTLSSVIIGIVPRRSAKEVRSVLLLRSCLFFCLDEFVNVTSRSVILLYVIMTSTFGGSDVILLQDDAHFNAIFGGVRK